MLHLTVFGPMELVDSAGQDRLPAGRKAQGLIALLALSRNHKRGRIWLQDKLWSRSGQEQGAGSLRQCLTEIRAALGPYAEVLGGSNGYVWLDKQGFSLELTSPNQSIAGEFLEGLNINDPEFDDWLRDMRSHFEQDTTETLTTPIQQHSRSARVHLSVPSIGESTSDTWFSNALQDQVRHSLSDMASIQFESGAKPSPNVPFVLCAEGGQINMDWLVRFWLTDSSGQQTIWSLSKKLKAAGSVPIDTVEAHELVSTVAQEVIERVADIVEQSDPLALLFFAQRQIFSLKQDAMRPADAALAAAHDREPRGVYLGWRSFLRLTQVFEHRHEDTPRLLREAHDFAEIAMQDDPKNAYVLSFASQVRLLVEDDAKSAFMLAKRAIELDPSNPFSWAYYALAQVQLGQPQKAHLSALRARYVARSSPFVFWWDMLCCLTACGAGKVDEALRHAESVRAFKPSYRPVLRYLYPLYLAQNKQVSAQRVLERLVHFEPEFCPEVLLSADYPAATLRKTRLIELIA